MTQERMAALLLPFIERHLLQRIKNENVLRELLSPETDNWILAFNSFTEDYLHLYMSLYC